MILRTTIRSKVSMMRISLLIMYGLFSLSALSQRTTTINLNEIPQRKVRKYIVSREIDKMQNFSSIHSSWNKDINESDFNVNERTFYMQYKLSDVWQCYSHANPMKVWNGRSMRLGLMITKYLNSVIYTDNSLFPDVDTSQVYFLDLRLLKGLYNLPVAFEIITIDNSRQIVEISYLDNNKSQGKQSIQFFDNMDGRTRIVHRSYFKSSSWLRDEFLYPYFHKKFIKEFHRNMNELVRNSSLAISVLKN
jgi:hypothetical protein